MSDNFAPIPSRLIPVVTPMQKYWLLIATVSLTATLALCVALYKVFFANNLVIQNQGLRITIDIQKLKMEKPGFLVVDSVHMLTRFVLMSEYIPKGVHENLSIPYASTFLSKTKTNELRGYIYEDSDNDQTFNIAKDKIKTDVFGAPLIRRFSVTYLNTKSIACSSGFIDDFNGSVVDAKIWRPSIWNYESGGFLTQSAVDNVIRNDSTTLYSQDLFSGDFETKTTIQSFDGPGTVEFETFDSEDRVASVKLVKSNTESYLTLGLSAEADKQLTQSSESTPSSVLIQKYNIPIGVPLSLKIKRVGSSLTASYLGEDGSYNDIWNVPHVSTEPVNIGIETADNSVQPHKVTSVVDNISIGCPSI